MFFALPFVFVCMIRCFLWPVAGVFGTLSGHGFLALIRRSVAVRYFSTFCIAVFLIVFRSQFFTYVVSSSLQDCQALWISKPQ